MVSAAISFGIIFLILELILSGSVYLSFAITSFITAGIMLLTTNGIIITALSIVALSITLSVIRPKILITKKNMKLTKEINKSYIGKIAQIVQTTDNISGVLSINNERWQARTRNVNDVIEQGQQAKITNYKDIVMYVEKV